MDGADWETRIPTSDSGRLSLRPGGRREALSLRAADIDRRRIYEIPYIWSSQVLLSDQHEEVPPGGRVCAGETMHGCHEDSGLVSGRSA
jgi:hypothetical protein